MAESRANFNIAWITNEWGLQQAEKHLSESFFYEPKDFARDVSDKNAYLWGRVDSHNVVIIAAPSNVPASVTVKTLLAAVPNIRFGLFVGTGAANPKPSKDLDIRLGDLVVGQPAKPNYGVVQYDIETVKMGQDTKQASSHEPLPTILTTTLQSLIHEWALEAASFVDDVRHSPPTSNAARDRLFDPSYTHSQGKNCLECDQSRLIKRCRRDPEVPLIFSGIIASSNYVVQDVEVGQMIEIYVGERCVCFDTMAAGLMPNFPCLNIRGISRYADSHKTNVKWDMYAAAVAAKFTQLYIRALPTSAVNVLTKAATACNGKC
jgi:nucleoside phosphorylase